MPEISISTKLRSLCPNLRLGCIEADVNVYKSSGELLAELNDRILQIGQSLSIESISKIPAIETSRKAYKACGKDPARYRLSAEALLRRIVLGKGLYHINNVVDQLNLVSITTGFSIGGYDAEQIKGDIVLGIGDRNEQYFGIGRGELNIENIPVFRDNLGAFGTPTSDSPRTGVSSRTSRFLMVLIDFGGSNKLDQAKELSNRLLIEYCSATNLNEFDILK